MTREPTSTLEAPRHVASHTHVDEVPLYGGARAIRLRRRRRALQAGAAALVVAMLAGTAFVLTQRNVTTAVSLDAAVESFREVPAGAAKVEKTTETSKTPTAAARPDAASESAKAPATKAAADPKPATSAPFALPAQGVYTYLASGGESVSTFGAKHDYPDETYATVRHLGGCRWEHTNRVIEEHVDTRVLCSDTGVLKQLDQRRDIEFFGQRDGGSMGTCDPEFVLYSAGEKPGAVRTIRCDDGEGTISTVKRTFVGAEAITIGKDRVDALRIDLDSTMTGQVDGSSTDSLWVSARDGMTLRWERTVDTLATAYGARVRYKEDATFILKDLEPKR